MALAPGDPVRDKYEDYMSSQVKSCVVDINNGAQILECRQGMTLFAALRTHNLLLPTGCGAKGQCGQCKVRLLKGEGGLFTDNEVKLLGEDERAEGHRLACQLRLSGDIAIEVPESVFQAREHEATLTAVTPLTYDIRRFSFALNPGDSIPHRSGQFLTLSVRIPEAKSQVMRCFSFATQSSVTGHVDIIVRRNPKGVLTPYLFEHAAPGDAVKIIAPYGDFYLREGRSPCIWIAGGSGLSPFLGMVHDMIDKKIERPVHLFFGAVMSKDLYYVDLLNNIAQQHDWFQFTPALSGDEQCDCCHDYGLITDVVGRRVDNASDSEGYLCGSPGMIAACLKVLTEKGMPRTKIFYDRF